MNVATALRGLVFGHGENSFPFCFFYPAVVASAWLGGLYPGLLASVGSLVVSKYLFVAPVRSFAVASESELVSLVLFFIVAVLLSILSEAVIRERAANQSLRACNARSETRFRMLAANAPVGIFITDESGACQFVNERWCELTGAAAKDRLGKNWLEAVEKRSKPIADVEQGHISTSSCILANLSMQLGGRPINLDPQTGQVKGERVQPMLARPYRGDFKHPAGASGEWKPWTWDGKKA